MGCGDSREEALRDDQDAGGQALPGERRKKAGNKPTKDYKRPVWKSEEHLSANDVQDKCDVFWDTQPHYGGSREIWDALKGACEAEDMETCKLIIESAGIIVATHDMTIFYDERGAKYELPKYVLSLPTNLAS